MPTQEELEQRAADVRAGITAQGGKVKSLKDDVKAKKKAKESTDEADRQVAEGVEQLKALKASLVDIEIELENVTGVPRNKDAFREAVNKVLENRLFYKPAFNIYGGVAGLFDYGPPGTAVKSNITQFWRQHFVFAESMLELECPAVTPEAVLKPSGHVDRFVDYMVRDELKNCFRADHVLETKLEEIVADPTASDAHKQEAQDDLIHVGEMDCDTLRDKLTAYGCVSPDPPGGAISAPFAFNLMFRTSIGPRGDVVGFLRPETAQGIFVSFRDLLYYNGGKLPFAAAQIGQSFRNEINPKQGLLRVREFTQAEIEHFVHPEHKEHPRFKEVAHVAPIMASAQVQQQGTAPAAMALEDAVKQGVVANETLAYFIGRTYLFMVAVGINPKRMMFRQHLPNEMAHYASDCWDCEVDTTYGWIECAGLADRSAFDLSNHSKASKIDLVAYEQYDAPRTVEVVEVTPQMKVLGKELKAAGKAVSEHLQALPEDDALALKAQLADSGSAEIAVDGKSHTIRSDMVTIEKVTKTESGRNYTPSVIEPSFGIGRVLYCVFEHSFYTRPGDDQQRTVFRFTPTVAPMKTTVFPLLQRQELNEVASRISLDLRRAGISSIIDTTGITIGKRYARTDELGVPFAITVDYDTLHEGSKKDSVTLRERDSMEQVRVPVSELVAVMRGLCENVAEATTWDALKQQYPLQAAPSEP